MKQQSKPRVPTLRVLGVANCLSSCLGQTRRLLCLLLQVCEGTILHKVCIPVKLDSTAVLQSNTLVHILISAESRYEATFARGIHFRFWSETKFLSLVKFSQVYEVYGQVDFLFSTLTAF